MAESAYQDLLKDTSESKENGNYFLVTITDLNPNTTYPIQFRWIYKDKRPNQNWSAVKLITTPGESEPNTPSFNSSNVDTTQPEKIIITWNGQSDDSDVLSNYDRVDVYIDGLPFDGTKAAYSFKAPGTAIIPAPAGTYQIVLYAVSKTGKLSPVSAAVTKSVSAIGEVVEAPTNPSGFSSRRILAGIEVSWAGTYANGTFTGFEAIKIYAGTSASATSGTYTEVGVLTGNNVKNTIVVPVDGTYVAYGQAVYIHAAAVNKNGTVGTIQANVTNQPLGPGKATDADINDGAVVISKLASDVLTVGNLKAGDINSTSYIRAGTANSARVEISSSTVGSVLPGLTVYSSDGTQMLRAPLSGGLTINGGGTFTGDLSAGSGNSIFKSDSNGIYLGNASYSSAPFSVSRNGIIKAQSGTIGGWTLGSTYLQGNNLKLDTSGIVVGSTSSSYFDISPTSLTHRNANGTASGKFTLTLGPSPQLTIDGTITVGGSSVATQSQLDGYATDGDLSTGLGTKISNGGAAADVNSNTTTISGGKIRTGSIESTTYSAPGGFPSSAPFSQNGMSIVLDNQGSIISKSFVIDSSGNAFFKGDITGASGTFSGAVNIGAQGTNRYFASSYTRSIGANAQTWPTGTGVSLNFVGVNGIAFQNQATSGWATSCYPFLDAGANNAILSNDGSTYVPGTYYGNMDLGVSALRWRRLRIFDTSYFGQAKTDTSGNSYTIDENGDAVLNGYGIVGGYGVTSSWAPRTNAGQTLGTSTQRWGQIYSNSSTILTSDQRLKTNIQISELGLDFINKLNPVSYKWIVGDVKEIQELVEDEWTGPGEKIRATYKTVSKVIGLDENGKEIVETETRPGVRTHYGLIAQQVKEVLDEIAPGKDFAGWVKQDINDPDSLESLRYDQFISPIIKSIQEISTKLNFIQQRLDAIGA